MGVGVLRGKLPQVSIDMLQNSITPSVIQDLKDEHGKADIFQMLVDLEDNTVLLKYRTEDDVDRDLDELEQFKEN